MPTTLSSFEEKQDKKGINYNEKKALLNARRTPALHVEGASFNPLRLQQLKIFKQQMLGKTLAWKSE